MSVEIEKSNSASGDASVSSGHQAAAAAAAPPAVKKKRNLPGMPDPDAEVIALSPNTLMATNRFVCEICSKGFQRDQNLQLHRRGHNLPWKLRLRVGNAEEARKRVYVCPEGSCLHHHPSRALGDLTGIKKHFFRKHGEKKWKCDKCTKKYAVHSDWKAHYKTCGTREYRCDCGTLFSRRDSFVTHRSSCNALVVESAMVQPLEVAIAAATVVPVDDPDTDQQDPANATGIKGYLPTAATPLAVSSSATGKSNTVISSEADIFASSTRSPAAQGACFSDLIRDRSMAAEAEAMGPTSLCLTTSTLRSIAPPPHMSATALLQKAAQIGATVSKASFLTGFGLQWSPHNQQQVDPASLGLGFPYDGEEPPPGLFLQKPSATTLDFLGLGMGMGTVGPSKVGLSALIGGGFDMEAPVVHYGGGSSPERNPSSPAIL